MKEIGGYPGLELNQGAEYHPNALHLNTGRNCFEYILSSNDYVKMHVPYYICKAFLEPIKKLNVDYEYYRIDANLDPIFDKKLRRKEAFLYVNYFGLKDKIILKLAQNYQNNLIIDNSQAFYSTPQKQIDTFYSARKFFGVPDGAYLYTDKSLNVSFEQDVSYTRMEHLLRRIDVSAESAYYKFIENENSLVGQPIKLMSKLTRALLCNIDYKNAKLIRERNFLYLHDSLNKLNELDFSIEDLNGPMIYPLLITKEGLRQKLIEAKIYIAAYWPDVLHLLEKNCFECKLANFLLPLPIDQRYDLNIMDKIVKTVNDL
jgi:hypothetical protein